MKLVDQISNTDCVAASLAMLLDVSLGYVKSDLFAGLDYPFPEPWSKLPKIPDMNVICDWAINVQHIALVPFELDPVCTPHPDCPPVPVWPRNQTTNADGPWMFNKALERGKGLLEGRVLVGKELSHMVAWDGAVIYDPRGYCYSINVAKKFQFEPRRFWLAVDTRR